MKQLYLFTLIGSLPIPTVLAQSWPSATAVQFVIVHEQNKALPLAAPARYRSDVLLQVTDTLPPPPIRYLTKPVRTKTTPVDDWEPDTPTDEPDWGWSGLFFGPRPTANLPRIAVPRARINSTLKN